MLVQERGIDFEPTDDYLQEVRLAGGEDELISALKSAKVTKPATVDPAAQTRQAELRQHMARGVQFANEGQYAAAEQEYRASLILDPENADIYVSLSYVLNMQRKWDDAVSAAREAVNLNPSNDAAHSNLAFALGFKGDMDGDIAEYREALRLNPNNATAHEGLGVALGSKGDRGGAIAECRNAYVLDPGEPLVRQAYAQALTNSWPSLIMSGEGSLPTSWSDTWRFYVYHCSPYEGMCWEGTDAPADACHGVLEVGNGRIKHFCIHKKYSFDAALSDVREAKIFNNHLVITLRDGKKTRTVEFVAADRLGHTACPSLSPGARSPSDALLDAILQATGK